MNLSLAAMEKIMKENGAQRVAEDAKAELAKVLEKVAMKLSKDANDIAMHSGRTTVMARDIALASKDLR